MHATYFLEDNSNSIADSSRHFSNYTLIDGRMLKGSLPRNSVVPF